MKINATEPQKPPKHSAQHRHVLQVMADLFKWNTICEIGVWKGDTGAHLLELCPQLIWTGVDPYAKPQGDMREPGFCNYGNPDFDALYRRTHDRFSLFGKRARLLRVTSSEAALEMRLDNAMFDCVFIDGDHRYEQVVRDIDAWRTFVPNGGWLMGHDYDMPSVREAVAHELPKGSVLALPDRVWAFQF